VRAVVQRVREASVSVADDVVGVIGHGVVVLLGIAEDDTHDAGAKLAGRIARLRIFENEEGRFDRSLLEVDGAALVVSQFTLIADTAKGNRPDFSGAAPRDQAEPLYEAFCEALQRDWGVDVATGVFGAYMELEIVNDGPVTIVFET
jgi:D-aminoacyl-tRNA deacylase